MHNQIRYLTTQLEGGQYTVEVYFHGHDVKTKFLRILISVLISTARKKASSKDGAFLFKKFSPEKTLKNPER
jgi:hypothetical protein